MGNENIPKPVETCKYFGIVMDAHVDFQCFINLLAQSGTRALGALIHKNKTIDMSILYNTL